MRQVKLHRVVMFHLLFPLRDKLATDALESAENEGWPIRPESLDEWMFPARAEALRCGVDGAAAAY